MRPSVAFALLLGFSLPATAAEPALERVLLSTGGVGYLGFSTKGGDIRLRVPLRQVDDVLKSLIVTDAGGGEVRAVTLPGPTPLDDPFRETPFGPGDLGSLPQLLAKLQGSLVEVTGSDFAPSPLRGRVLAIVPEETVDGEGRRTVRHRLSLLTETVIRSVLLENLDGVTPADPELRASLGLVLARLADQQLQPMRELAVALGGVAPDGRVRLGYLAEMPVWKAAYRLVAGDADGLLQGWAILENLSGRDWREVEVTLIAGSPIALRQALYRSYFVPRPEVPVLAEAEVPPPSMALDAAPRIAGAAAAAPPALERAAATELTAQTLYRLPRAVTLPEGETVMAPLVDRAVPVARLARYRAGQAGPHPEAALRLRNVADASLPGGIATLYERLDDGALTFLGDAALPPLAPGEEAVLAYGRDGNIEIGRREDGGRRLERARIVDGVLELTRVERLTTIYRATARFAGPARELVVEQALPPGWRVAAPADAAVEGDVVRVSTELAAGAARELTVVTERPELERVVLVDADPDRLLLDAAGEVPPELRAALDRLRGLAAAVAEAERAVAATDARRAERVAEQERLRANLEAVPPESDLARRYLGRLGASEEEITGLDRQLEALRGQVEAAARERRDFLRTLRL